MSDILTVSLGATAAAADNTKRRQIIEGARAVFLTQGFDAASMSDIARKAGVSKGTLYVYFKNKDELFEAITEEQCGMQAERVFELDNADRDVAAVLAKLGTTFATFMCNRSTSPIRTVIAIADRMPEIGRQFYETGPAVGIAKLSRYLRAQIDAGVLEIAPEDCDIVASQFLESCLSTTFKPVLFNFAPPPAQERIDHVVAISVRAFMKAYGRTN
ncbi:MAG: TetR/AcrR family transcriptional regulator [Alphaproteobacteria bacterium]|nr:TetR/AcrR family transcriptional regulator [Alphaproteobacteria bacterium]